MYKNETSGEWEHDFRVPGLPRYRACYGTKKADAERLHHVATAVFKARDPELVHALKRRGVGSVTLEQYAQLRERGLPFVEALRQATPVEPWGSIGDAVARYVTAFENNENKSDGTTDVVTAQLNRWLAFQDPATPLDAITAADMTALQDGLKAERYAPNTVTQTMARVGALYRWCMRREAIDARDSKRPARPLYVPIDPETVTVVTTRRERYLSEEEASRLLAATPRAMLFPVAAGVFGGFRINEMLHLRPGFDVNTTDWTLAVQVQPDWRPKTERSARYVPVATVLRPILEHHLAHYASEDWLTPATLDPSRPLNEDTFNRHFQRIVRDAELVAGRKDPQGVTYHTLRHTFASWLLMAGADMYTVAKLLGNSVKQVEDTYGHLSKDHRQAAVDRLSVKDFATSLATLRTPE